MTNTEKIARWKTDCDVIGANLTVIATSWKYYRLTLTIINGSSTLNKHPAAYYLHNFLLRGFADSVIIGVRRQMDKDSRVVSLVNLLNDLKRNGAAYTLDECLETFRNRALRFDLDPGPYKARAEAVYAAIASDDGKKISGRAIKAQIRSLREKCDKVVHVGNTHVASAGSSKPHTHGQFETAHLGLVVPARIGYLEGAAFR